MWSVLLRRVWLVVLTVLSGEAAGQAEEVRLFVSAMVEQEVQSLVWNGGGKQSLVRLATVQLPGQPAALAPAADGRRLFVTLRSTGQLASLAVDDTGRMNLVNVVDAGADPAHIALDATGRWLLTAYYVAGKVSVHRIDDAGRLLSQPHQEWKTAEKAHAIVLDPSQRFAFAPHTGGETIYQFAWDAAAGKLTPLTIPQRSTTIGTGPRHLVWRAQGDVAYVSNEQANSATAWGLVPATGLEPLSKAPTLPVEFRQPNSTAEIKLHPSGRTLYVANRGHDSLAVLGVSEDGRRLTPVGHLLTEKTPRSFDLDRSGRWLFVAGESSGRLAVYEVDDAGRRLTLRHTASLAEKLWWVTAGAGH